MTVETSFTKIVKSESETTDIFESITFLTGKGKKGKRVPVLN